ncbi:hypothetical protein P7C73_g929, partial [Tremellales sp. Uapishka_1]
MAMTSAGHCAPLKRRRSPSSPSSEDSSSTAYRKVRSLPRPRLVSPNAFAPKPVLRASLLVHRGEGPAFFSSEDTDTECDADTDLGTGLSDVELDLCGSEKSAESPIEAEGDEVDTVLMGSPSSPLSPCPVSPSPMSLCPVSPSPQSSWKGKSVDPLEYQRRKRRRYETFSDDGEGDDENEGEDDEMETEDLLSGEGPRALAPTKSIMNITNCMNGLMDTKSAAVLSQWYLEKPTLLRTQNAGGRSRALQLKRKKVKKSLKPFDLHRDLAQPIILAELDSPMDISDVESGDSLIDSFSGRSHQPMFLPARLRYRPSIPLTKAQRACTDRPLGIVARAKANRVCRSLKHQSSDERLAGQPSTKHLHRSSPTSLLPTRRIPGRHHYALKSRAHFTLFPGGSCEVGHRHLKLLQENLGKRVRRRDLVQAFNRKTKDGQWLASRKKWFGYDLCKSSENTWWLADEGEVEGILESDPAEHVELRHLEIPTPTVTSLDAGIESHHVTPIKRPVETRPAGDAIEEVSVRWARRNELRMKEEVVSHVREVRSQIRGRNTMRREAEEQARRQCEEAARRRIDEELAARRHNEEERLRETERLREIDRLRAAERSRQEEERIRGEENRARQARESSTSTTQSVSVSQVDEDISPGFVAPSASAGVSPPRYEFPFFPIIQPRPRHAPTRSIRRVSGPNEPPIYVSHAYNRRSPSPPPPYNARTDRQTLIAPVFIADDLEEEATLRDIRPDGGAVLPRPRIVTPTIVGAFPVESAIVTPVSVRPRSAWEAALDLEEGEEVEDAFDEVVHRPVLGTLGRWFGGLWRG